MFDIFYNVEMSVYDVGLIFCFTDTMQRVCVRMQILMCLCPSVCVTCCVIKCNFIHVFIHTCTICTVCTSVSVCWCVCVHWRVKHGVGGGRKCGWAFGGLVKS